MAEVAKTLAEFESSARAGRRNALPDILDVPETERNANELAVHIQTLKLDEIDETRKSDSACASPTESDTNKTENQKNSEQNDNSSTPGS
ncbi:uncharacterized protein LOC144350042 [Saccoglossus kowalevskii]